MDQQKRINKILEAVEAKVQEEVGALLGSKFSVTSGLRQLVSKAEAFEQLLGKQVCAKLDITGEVTGNGCLLISIKDAIRLGGTLIMLPDSELQEVIGREEYREEIEDSYGEIANIIAGSITKVFEEMYPKTCRFIRKEQEVLQPTKIDIDSETPIAKQTYYFVSSSMVMDGRQMGDMVVLIPAKAFELEQVADGVESAPESLVGNAQETGSPAPERIENGEQDTPPAAPLKAVVDLEVKKPKIDPEKQRKKVDHLLAECEKRLTSEVSALLGVDILFAGLATTLMSKEEFFLEQAVGKQVMADLEVVGDLQDTCYFSLSIKDAIHLGGVLIMLPPAELLNVINEEDFSEDGRDAYGEVANIVSGVYTKVFEEQYSEKLRFIRKTLREIVPVKVAVETDEPIPNQLYYCHCLQLLVAGKQLGSVNMLFPARLLHLEMQPLDQVEQAASTEPSVTRPSQQTDKKEKAAESQIPPPATKTIKVPSQAREPAEKQKKLVDKLLSASVDKLAAEVSALLGADVQLSNQNCRVIEKERFLSEEVSGKQVIAHMDVVGELTGKSYLVVNLRDAIRIGGILIMLPSQELESVVSEENFGEDTQDAFSEVANIISGVYTAVFEEQYSKKIRFIKTELEQILPMKVATDSSQPFPDGNYYLSSSDLSIGGSVLGKVNFVIPLGLFGLEGLVAVDEEVEVEDTASPSHQYTSPGSSTPLDILVIGDDEMETAKITAVLSGMNFSIKSLSFKDNVHNFIPGELKAIYLVMQNVNEQAFGAAIKISSTCSLPLIAAGPGWTRSKVIKAVKYGIRDILLTPASTADIEENVTNNLLKLAA